MARGVRNLSSAREGHHQSAGDAGCPWALREVWLPTILGHETPARRRRQPRRWNRCPRTHGLTCRRRPEARLAIDGMCTAFTRGSRRQQVIAVGSLLAGDLRLGIASKLASYNLHGDDSARPTLSARNCGQIRPGRPPQKRTCRRRRYPWQRPGIRQRWPGRLRRRLRDGSPARVRVANGR